MPLADLRATRAPCLQLLRHARNTRHSHAHRYERFPQWLLPTPTMTKGAGPGTSSRELSTSSTLACSSQHARLSAVRTECLCQTERRRPSFRCGCVLLSADVRSFSSPLALSQALAEGVAQVCSDGPRSNALFHNPLGELARGAAGAAAACSVALCRMIISSARRRKPHGAHTRARTSRRSF